MDHSTMPKAVQTEAPADQDVSFKVPCCRYGDPDGWTLPEEAWNNQFTHPDLMGKHVTCTIGAYDWRQWYSMDCTNWDPSNKRNMGVEINCDNWSNYKLNHVKLRTPAGQFLNGQSVGKETNVWDMYKNSHSSYVFFEQKAVPVQFFGSDKPRFKILQKQSKRYMKLDENNGLVLGEYNKDVNPDEAWNEGAWFSAEPKNRDGNINGWYGRIDTRDFFYLIEESTEKYIRLRGPQKSMGDISDEFMQTHGPSGFTNADVMAAFHFQPWFFADVSESWCTKNSDREDQCLLELFN